MLVPSVEISMDSHPSFSAALPPLQERKGKERGDAPSDIPHTPRGTACASPALLTQPAAFGGSAAGERPGGSISLLKKTILDLFLPSSAQPCQSRLPEGSQELLTVRGSLHLKAYNYPVCLPRKGQLGSECAPVPGPSPACSCLPNYC